MGVQGSMDSNGGSGGAQYTNDYASDDEFEEEEEVSYNTAAVVSGLFARQYRRAMKDIARKEALLVEEEHKVFMKFGSSGRSTIWT